MEDLSTHNRVYPFIGRNRGHQTIVTLAAIIPLLLTIGGMVMAWTSGWFAWQHLVAMLFMATWGGLGITVGFHRFLAHGTFKAGPVTRFMLIWMGTTTLQGGPASWAATHKRHHALSDQPGDPHSPVEGLYHSHFGWLLRGNLVHSGPAHDRLMQSKVVAFWEKYQLLAYVLGFIMPGILSFALGGGFWLGVLWGGAVRVFLVHHITWSINSVCHSWGTRPYTSPDIARNNAIFGLLGWGEGWHNNHHAFPRSAYIGHRWYQVDLGKYFLITLRAFGLVRDVQVPTKEERRARLSKNAQAKADKTTAEAA